MDRLAEDDLGVEIEAKNEEEPGMGGMGILNTVLRLRIFFQSRFDFEIKENALGEGSAVYLRVCRLGLAAVKKEETGKGNWLAKGRHGSWRREE